MVSPPPSGRPPGHLLGDAAVLIDVVEVESPLQLLLRCAPQQDGQPDDKVLPGEREGVDGTVMVSSPFYKELP